MNTVFVYYRGYRIPIYLKKAVTETRLVSNILSKVFKMSFSMTP